MAGEQRVDSDLGSGFGSVGWRRSSRLGGLVVAEGDGVDGAVVGIVVVVGAAGVVGVVAVGEAGIGVEVGLDIAVGNEDGAAGIEAAVEFAAAAAGAAAVAPQAHVAEPVSSSYAAATPEVVQPGIDAAGQTLVVLDGSAGERRQAAGLPCAVQAQCPAAFGVCSPRSLGCWTVSRCRFSRACRTSLFLLLRLEEPVAEGSAWGVAHQACGLAVPCVEARAGVVSCLAVAASRDGNRKVAAVAFHLGHPVSASPEAPLGEQTSRASAAERFQVPRDGLSELPENLPAALEP